MRQTLRTTLALLLLLAFVPHAAEAKAKGVKRLRLVRGRAVASGVLRPGTTEARHEYVFNAKAGQRLAVRVTSGRLRLPGGMLGAVFSVTDEAGSLPPSFGDYPYGGPTGWTGALPRGGTYKITVEMEDTPDDPDEATYRRMKLSLRYRLSVTLR